MLPDEYYSEARRGSFGVIETPPSSHAAKQMNGRGHSRPASPRGSGGARFESTPGSSSEVRATAVKFKTKAARDEFIRNRYRPPLRISATSPEPSRTSPASTGPSGRRRAWLVRFSGATALGLSGWVASTAPGCATNACAGYALGDPWVLRMERGVAVLIALWIGAAAIARMLSFGRSGDR